MLSLPMELVDTPEDTAVVGDLDAFMDYVESGQAMHDWDDRVTVLTSECEAYLQEHRHVWDHIVIRYGEDSS